MQEYTFTSTNPSEWEVVQCPVNYIGASNQVTWTASNIMTMCNIVVLDETDFIEYSDAYNHHRKMYMDRIYKVIDAMVMTFITEHIKMDNVLEQLDFMKDENGFVEFTSQIGFTLIDMSYRMRQALGFYYGTFPKEPIYDELRSMFLLKARAIGYSMLSPMWYILSNLGSPNSVSRQDNPWYCSNAAIAMRIQNSFVNEQPLSFSNSEFITTSQASSLSNIKCMVVDSNLEPIKFLNPIAITISVKDIPINEDKMAQFEQQPANRELNKQIREKQHSNALQQSNHYKKWSNPESISFEVDYGKMFKDDKEIASKHPNEEPIEPPEEVPQTENPVVNDPPQE
jgi:hypothetical protein